MYANGMSERDIADAIEDIYGFDISYETVSNITDRVIETAEEWQSRPLKKFYVMLDSQKEMIKKKDESLDVVHSVC